jgi:hypothetical protein
MPYIEVKTNVQVNKLMKIYTFIPYKFIYSLLIHSSLSFTDLPFLHLFQYKQVQDHKQFIKELSTYVATALNKSPCVTLQDNLSMIFNDSEDPAYIVEVTVIGIDSPTIKKVNKELSEFFEKELKASSDRGYIFFYNPDGANVGWKGSVCG